MFFLNSNELIVQLPTRSTGSIMPRPVFEGPTIGSTRDYFLLNLLHYFIGERFYVITFSWQRSVSLHDVARNGESSNARA